MSEAREFHDGRHDGLIALESLDLDKVTSFSDLLHGMAKTALQAFAEKIRAKCRLRSTARCRRSATLPDSE